MAVIAEIADSDFVISLIKQGLGSENNVLN